MYNELFTERTKIQQLNVETAIAAASYPASGSFIDVSNFERFVFLICVGALDTELTFKVQQAATVSGSPKDVTSATVVVPANGDNKWYSIEVQSDHLDINNGYNYVTLTSTGASGSNDYAAILFFGVNPGERPATQGSDKGSIVSVVG